MAYMVKTFARKITYITKKEVNTHMTNITVVWKNHNIKKVELTEEQANEIFGGIEVNKLDERLQDLQGLENGFYVVEGLEQYFEISDSRLSSKGVGRLKDIILPCFKPSVIRNYLSELAERAFQEVEGEILAEITVFNNDMSNELVFVDDVAKLKDYKHKSLEVVSLEEGSGWYDLRVDGRAEVNIVYNEDMNKYSSYDGVEGCGWYDTIKEAVKSYMDYTYRYKNPYGDEDEYYEPSCSACGDGGCFHCEPHRFL